MEMIRKNPYLIIAVSSVIILMAAAVFWTTNARESESVGFIQVQQVLAGWPDFIGANQEFNTYAAELQEEYKDRLEDASESEKTELMQEIQTKMQKTNDEMVKPYDELLDKAIEDAQRSYGVDVVLSSDSVISGGVDLTETVTELVNEYTED